MTSRLPLALLLALPLMLGGCLLPQPDTPPIPPMSQAMGKASAPGARPASAAPSATPGATAAAGPTMANNAGGLVEDGSGRSAQTPTPPAASTAPTAPSATTEVAGDNALVSNGGGTPSGNGPPTMASEPAPGRLAVTFSGEAVTDVWVVPADGGPGAGAPVTDGVLKLDLPAGAYYMELTVSGRRLRTTKPISVTAGAERVFKASVAGDTITLTEAVPLENASPSPSPTPTP